MGGPADRKRREPLPHMYLHVEGAAIAAMRREHGSGSWIRTSDKHDISVLLYQLSYPQVKIGSRGRTRTYNLGVNSTLLNH